MRVNVTWMLLSVVLLASILMGCADQAGLGKPQIKATVNEWGDVTSSTTEIVTRIGVYNPNPVPLPIKDVLTEVHMNDVKMGEGSAVESEVKANTNSTIVISTGINNSRISQWWVTHIENDEVSTMSMKGDLVFDLSVTEFKYPIEKSKKIETDILGSLSASPQEIDGPGSGSLRVGSVESHWGEINEDHTEIVTTVEVKNDYPLEVSITEVSYVVEMNGIVMADHTNNLTEVLEPNSGSELSYSTKLQNDKLDEWWVTHIENNEQTEVKISVEAVLEAEEQQYEFDLMDQQSQFNTNLLG